jgi:DNA-binding Lrp family transcriptional regulator
MHEQARAGGDRRLQRAIILALLSEDAAQGSSRARLAEVLGIAPETLESALVELSEAGVVGLAGTEVWASAAARRIDELGLIGI